MQACGSSSLVTAVYCAKVTLEILGKNPVKCTKLIKGLLYLTYSERMRELQLASLEKRWCRESYQIHKYLTGGNEEKSERFFS